MGEGIVWGGRARGRRAVGRLEGREEEGVLQELREEGVTLPINSYWRRAAELGAGAGAGPGDASDPTPPGERVGGIRRESKKKYERQAVGEMG